MRGKNILLLSMVVLFSATTLTATANAETYTVEMDQNGFSVNSLSINDGDSVKFVNTHYVTNINLEPHAISDPFAVPYTINSYWILDDSTPSWTYTFTGCESYVFHDRFFDVSPIVIDTCGVETSVEENTETQYVETSVNSETNADIQSLTSELTTALEQVGLLQNQVISLQDNVVVLENEVSSLSADKSTLINENNNLQASLTTVTEERDYYQDKWEDWYAIALEQVRIMVEVLGISQ